jgi:hypothetical protein
MVVDRGDGGDGQSERVPAGDGEAAQPGRPRRVREARHRPLLGGLNKQCPVLGALERLRAFDLAGGGVDVGVGKHGRTLLS